MSNKENLNLDLDDFASEDETLAAPVKETSVSAPMHPSEEDDLKPSDTLDDSVLEGNEAMASNAAAHQQAEGGLVEDECASPGDGVDADADYSDDPMESVLDDFQIADEFEEGDSSVVPASSAAGKAKHGAPKKSRKERLDELPDYQKRSRKSRRILIVALVFAAALIAALVYFSLQLVETGNTLASQQENSRSSEADAAAGQQDANDASSSNVKRTEAPNLPVLIGKTAQEAVASIGHGAQVTLEADVNEEGNPVKKRVTVQLTDEPSDSTSGTPTVYLGLDEGGRVAMAGYSAATTSLGYGSLSFADAVSNEHIIEKTLQEAGLNVPEGTVILPAKSDYSTYGSDGTTLTKEQCSFEGSLNEGGSNYLWSAVLVYNYSAANASGNLADTIRQVYIYVNAA